jgi:hypothetical protein
LSATAYTTSNVNTKWVETIVYESTSLASTSVIFTALCTMPTFTFSTFIYYNVPLVALALLFVLHYFPMPRKIKHIPLRLTKNSATYNVMWTTSQNMWNTHKLMTSYVTTQSFVESETWMWLINVFWSKMLYFSVWQKHLDGIGW